MNLKKFLVLLSFIAFLSCDNANRSISKAENLGEMNMADEEQALTATQLKTDPANEVERKFIKNGHIDFETENLNKTREDIYKAIDKYNGYISSENEYKNSEEISSNFVIRIPADNFGNLIRELTMGVRRFDRKDIYLQDVTEEFVDIEARLRTKKELENRYREILKKATNVSEILEVEKQIGELRSEIESIEGRLNYLQNQFSLSTLTVRIYEPISTQTEFGKKFKNGFKNGWDKLILFFVLLVNIWPFILIIFGILILIRYFRKRRRTS
ncbi:DUF4349 domain-containing protein [Antarcticibacterium sp. 1MA-6-2]|uniref:DUF4349 domain-containing protein n=1 Tax=Antarcticibacterium sp. 1MA-6-2 TaxID=2908210 RepID=UPI001F405D64|nr:DUF4349 domain-containing protein [Antarcticibacterium sp. 1MA-6-2]UJH90964.1 DUF4349 domain-containing protein [Antarcticibacterium sp. 1MA-6-2]